MLQQTFDLDPVLMNTTNNNEYGLYLQTIIVTKKTKYKKLHKL